MIFETRAERLGGRSASAVRAAAAKQSHFTFRSSASAKDSLNSLTMFAVKVVPPIGDAAAEDLFGLDEYKIGRPGADMMSSEQPPGPRNCTGRR